MIKSCRGRRLFNALLGLGIYHPEQNVVVRGSGSYLCHSFLLRRSSCHEIYRNPLTGQCRCRLLLVFASRHRSCVETLLKSIVFPAMRLPLFVAAATAVSLLLAAEAHSDDHRYAKDEHVELWVNKVRFRTSRFGGGRSLHIVSWKMMPLQIWNGLVSASIVAMLANSYL